MNRSEAISIVAGRLALPREQVDKVVGEFFNVATEVLAKGETFAIRRFGKFEPRLRRAVTMPHPRTGVEMDVPEKVSAAFLPSDLLKEEMNSGE